MKLLRGSERDLKLDIASAQSRFVREQKPDECDPSTPLPSFHIESCKQFKSLCSKRIILPARANSTNEINKKNNIDVNEDVSCSQSRVDFHKTLSLLVKLGCGDKVAHERNPRRHVIIRLELYF